MSMKPDWREAGAISDKLFFTGLGFDDIKSVDASSSEGADYICDLNYTDMHSKIGKKFYLIIDGGTIEHVFHIPNCMKNIFDLLNVGGHIIHISPSNDRIDHGFYQFSPLLFHQYYVTNKFEIKQSLFMRCPSDNPNTTKPIQFGEYKPGSLDKFVTKGSVACSYATYFCVKKNEDSTANLMPHQYTYRNDAAQQAAEESPSG